MWHSCGASAGLDVFIIMWQSWKHQISAWIVFDILLLFHGQGPLVVWNYFYIREKELAYQFPSWWVEEKARPDIKVGYQQSNSAFLLGLLVALMCAVGVGLTISDCTCMVHTHQHCRYHISSSEYFTTGGNYDARQLYSSGGRVRRDTCKGGDGSSNCMWCAHYRCTGTVGIDVGVVAGTTTKR